jgi:hypothetical protein
MLDEKLLKVTMTLESVRLKRDETALASER